VTQGFLKRTTLTFWRCDIFRLVRMVSVFMRIWDGLMSVIWGGIVTTSVIISKEVPERVSLIIGNGSGLCDVMIGWEFG
jgi:hypothetical protein